MEEAHYKFGNDDAIKQFERTYGNFLSKAADKYGPLGNCIQATFQEVKFHHRPLDPVISCLGRVAVDRFFEVCLLCANGYGFGAQMPLRSMYEITVTAFHLHLNQSEIADFVDYHWIQDRKLYLSIVELLSDAESLHLPHFEGHLAKAEKKSKELSERFEISACKCKCGCKRLRHSWSKLDFTAMAKKIPALAPLYYSAYAKPLLQTHVTPRGLASNFSETKDGDIDFSYQQQENDISTVLVTAHNLILQSLGLQIDHFDQPDEVRLLLQGCLDDFSEVWKGHRIKAATH